MKMNLSVVMDVVNKTTKPLKEMSSDSDHYARKIKKIQQAQSDDSSALTMIASYQKIQKELDKNALEGEEATEKLLKLKQQMAATDEPSAALTNRLAKQTEKVALLNSKHQAYEEALGDNRKELKKATVDVANLDDEFERLSKNQLKHADNIDAVSKKYKRLKMAMSPIQKLSKSIKMPNLGSAAVGKGAALLGGLSLGGLFNEVNNTAAEMDSLAKISGNLNLPIGELQAMQSQAEHAGVSSDTMSAALGRFTKRLGVLQETGSGAMGSFLKKSGNSLHRELQGAGDTQQAYEKLLVSFSKLKTTQEQMAFADAAFGQDGRKMLIMLREGTEGLGAARKELNALGGGAKAEDAKKAEAYNDAMQKIQESIKSIKFAALTPVMEKVTALFTEFSNKFKNAKWRTNLIDKVIDTVNGLYDGIKFLGNIILFASQNFKGIIATLAMLKVALIAINAVIMANPIGLMVAAIGAAIVGVTYLIDRFIGFDVILKKVSDAIGWVWNGIKSMINMLPDALIPDGWKESIVNAGNEVDSLKTKMGDINNQEAQINVSTNSENIESLSGQINQLKDKSVQVGVNTQHEDVGNLNNKLSQIKDKTAQVGVTANSNDAVSLSGQINQLKDKSIQVGVNTQHEDVGNLNNQLSQIKDKNANIGITGNSEAASSVYGQISQIQDKSAHVGITTDSGDIKSVYGQLNQIKDKNAKIGVLTDGKGDEIDKLNNRLGQIKDKNAQIGITTKNQTETELSEKIKTVKQNSAAIGVSPYDTRTSTAQNNESGKNYPIGAAAPISNNQPLTNQNIKSQSEVSLTIKSEKPINVDKIKSDKGTELSLNVGNMGMSY